ncbi:RNA polymerase sigma factor [Leptospira fluminis]|uniref:RNA polymerase sigma factor n=1 Tax=Leptospira fluminis TaxID=2484979 RepID=A0A4R9GQQ5_9LEPT|nr:RNA polymerase sigma factor [Leptospira fluminis]TGK18971.1 RNA polymerase sigma factor [Leptospira fluminis]
MESSEKTISQTIERIHKSEYGQILASLVNTFGDWDLAEEALQESFLAAIQQWEQQGVPKRPGAWLLVVARRKALDRIRKNKPISLDSGNLENRSLSSEREIQEENEEIADERLKLIFTCCHPALPMEHRIALTLRTLGGLTTQEIASAFLLPVPTLAQRLVRAKKKIKESGIPFYIPPIHLLPERIESVLAVIYLIFTEGYASTSGDMLIRKELCDEAIRLCRMLEILIRKNLLSSDIPDEELSEVWGLLALMLLNHSRRDSRIDSFGRIVLLEEQDRTLWNREEIQEGLALLQKAISVGTVGSYLVQAAISAEHAISSHSALTDWKKISEWYELLLKMEDNPVVRLNHAVAVSIAEGPERGLLLLGALRKDLSSYAPYYLAVADVQKKLGSSESAKESYAQALAFTNNEVEKEFIRSKFRET